MAVGQWGIENKLILLECVPESPNKSFSSSYVSKLRW